jgi:hypothetical protein
LIKNIFVKFNQLFIMFFGLISFSEERRKLFFQKRPQELVKFFNIWDSLFDDLKLLQGEFIKKCGSCNNLQNLLKAFVFGKMEYFLIENFEIDKETGITVDQEFVDYVLVF